ncbi:coiled-coil domain-containing protein 81 isoform X2 [Choloepus didactylus]|uniref:coiled-coil domain-containing protein 81 isoform X2 n=1 Tax=Choloepus didactylus TaxID=27675 RepID=UPI00189E5E0F|nr:coiled-coil domain-containing protein 81 isoform X2 [Choloepus didactylus]
MLDRIVPVLQELSKQVLPTLPSLTQEEVSTIWENVSEFVERQLTLHKGVHIPGLGTFTFMRQKLEVGNNKFILIQRPMFIMAEKLVQIHGLKQNKVYTPGDIPIVPLNFVMISLEGPFNRDTVEGCVKETLLFLSRSISIRQNVEFTFKGIGVLVIKDSKVKMRFFKDFLSAMDESGTLVKALANRPGTVDSVLSSREDLCKQPSSALTFPRIEIKETENKPPLKTIVEEDEENRERKSKLKDQSDKGGIREISSPKRLRDGQALSPAKVTGINLRDKKSFLFDKWPLSPEINALKQEEYSQCLLKQMDNRREKEIKQRQNRELMDRLEQVQLTEELAAQRAKYLKDKMEETQCYKRALDAQIRNRHPHLTMFEPDSSEPIFGKNESELLVERCKREQNYMKHQLQAAAGHKRKAILHQLVDQKRDLQMLQRTHKEHLVDRTAELERLNRINQCLQEDWERSAAMKRQRDLEEKAFERERGDSGGLEVGNARMR